MTLDHNAADNWFERIRAKLVRGSHDYGDKSFDLHSGDLCEQIIDELADVAGWGFVLERRLARLQHVLERIEALGELETSIARAVLEFERKTSLGDPVGSSAAAAVSAMRDALIRAGTPVPGGAGLCTW